MIVLANPARLAQEAIAAALKPPVLTPEEQAAWEQAEREYQARNLAREAGAEPAA